MAFQKSITKTFPYQATPVTFTGYWVPQIQIDRVNKVASLNFKGYADQASREAHLQPVDEHMLTVTGDNFDTYFSTAVLTGSDVYKQAYDAALVTPDPVRGPRGTGTPVIFFADATEV